MISFIGVRRGVRILIFSFACSDHLYCNYADICLNNNLNSLIDFLFPILYIYHLLDCYFSSLFFPLPSVSAIQICPQYFLQDQFVILAPFKTYFYSLMAVSFICGFIVVALQTLFMFLYISSSPEVNLFHCGYVFLCGTRMSECCYVIIHFPVSVFSLLFRVMLVL